MLARTFRSAVELGITEAERDALIRVDYAVEDGTLPLDSIKMSEFHCGTRHCLAGWAHCFDQEAFPEIALEKFDLFIRDRGYGCNPAEQLKERIPVTLGSVFGLYLGSLKPADEAIKDLRQYLETGTISA